MMTFDGENDDTMGGDMGGGDDAGMPATPDTGGDTSGDDSTGGDMGGDDTMGGSEGGAM